MTTQITQHPCPNCKAALAFVTQNPDRGSGCVVALLGCLFAPLLIGVPVIFYGLHMRDKAVQHWHCTGCGRTYPIAGK